MSDYQEYLRELPAVDRLLREELLQRLLDSLPRRVVVAAAQETVERCRQSIRQAAEAGRLPEKIDLSPGRLAREAARLAQKRAAPSLRPVINATGVVLHTNLGRSPLAAPAVETVRAAGESFSNLEYDLESGQRGSRQAHLEALLCELTGAEAAVVVNNNAAAVFLALNTCAAGKEVIVSRGELVEIGGSFRIPDVMSASGARLVEVGTTNKSYLKDYEAAVTGQTALLLKVHTSNYHIIGFTASVEAAELVSLGRSFGIPVMEDLGSGVLLDLPAYGLPPEPRVQDAVAAGVDLVSFSGDKLLGGPQAGIIVGKGALVERIRKNQLARALRVDKFTVAALEATLRLYLHEEEAVREIPIWRMLTADTAVLRSRAEALARRLESLFGPGGVDVVPGSSRVGGGALPTAELPTYLVSVSPPLLSPPELAGRLRLCEPAVIVRVHQEKLLIDPRTVEEKQEEALLKAFESALRDEGEKTPWTT